MSLEPLSRSFYSKVALVTGAGYKYKGLGNSRAILIILAEEGGDVVCLD